MTTTATAAGQFACSKCKDTGSRYVAFYSSADRNCDCAEGRKLSAWAALTPAEQNARCSAEAAARREAFAAGAAARKAARQARREAEAAR